MSDYPIKKCDYCETTGVMPTFMNGETMCTKCLVSSGKNRGEILELAKERDQLKARAKGLVAQLGKLREEASIWKGMHAVAIEQREQLKTGYSEIQHEAEALKSSVYQLRAFLKTLTPMVCVMLKNMISEKLAEEPAQSLAEHDAALLEAHAEGIHRAGNIGHGFYGSGSSVLSEVVAGLRSKAARIREEADK